VCYRTSKLLQTVVALLLTPSLATAGDGRGPSTQGEDFFLKFGGAIPIESTSLGGPGSDAGGTGFILGLEYLRPISNRLSAGFEASFARRSKKDSTGSIANARTEASGSSRFFMTSIRWRFRPRRKITPHLGARLGAHNSNISIKATPLTGYAWSDTSTTETRTIIDDSKWGLAYGVTAGTEMPLGKSLDIGFEAQYLTTSDSKYSLSTQASGMGLVANDSSLAYLNFVCQVRKRY